MDIKENIAGLGKDHDEDAREKDLQKKQSEAKPGAENIDMEPHSVNKDGNKGFSDQSDKADNLDSAAKDYSNDQHQKAQNWESRED